MDTRYQSVDLRNPDPSHITFGDEDSRRAYSAKVNEIRRTMRKTGISYQVAPAPDGAHGYVWQGVTLPSGRVIGPGEEIKAEDLEGFVDTNGQKVAPWRYLERLVNEGRVLASD